VGCRQTHLSKTRSNMVFTWNAKCVIPENIHTPPPPTPRRVTETQRGVGGVQKESISEAVGWFHKSFFRGLQARLMSKLSYHRWSFICGRLSAFFTACVAGGYEYFLELHNVTKFQKIINNVKISTTRLQRDLTYSNSPNLQGNLCPVSSRLSRIIILPHILCLELCLHLLL